MSFLPNEMLWWFASCAIASWLLAHAYRWWAVRMHILAHPNERSAVTHTVPTPTGGGISFLVTLSGGLLVLWMRADINDTVALAWLGPIVIGFVGFIDDLHPLSVKVRAPVYFLLAGWCIYWIGFPELNIAGATIDPGTFGLVFGVLSLVWLQNLYNFMDGIDGLAIGEAAFVCVSVLVIGGERNMGDWNATLVVLLGACVGFAIINWPKAKVFMGDAGAGLLGLALGMLALAYHQVSVWTWMILLAYFLTDACLTILVRLFRGEKIYESHNLHAYQHLTRSFGGKRVLIGVLLVDTVWLYPLALLSQIFPNAGSGLLVLASVPLLICQYLCGAGQQQPRLNLVRT